MQLANQSILGTTSPSVMDSQIKNTQENLLPQNGRRVLRPGKKIISNVVESANDSVFPLDAASAIDGEPFNLDLENFLKLFPEETTSPQTESEIFAEVEARGPTLRDILIHGKSDEVIPQEEVGVVHEDVSQPDVDQQAEVSKPIDVPVVEVVDPAEEITAQSTEQEMLHVLEPSILAESVQVEVEDAQQDEAGASTVIHQPEITSSSVTKQKFLSRLGTVFDESLEK